MNDYIIKTDSLSKHYGRFAANEKISIGIKKGSIYGLVGRNSAGKTTFMKMICSLSSPTSGSFDICGKSYPQLGNARSKIGNLIEAPGIYANMSHLTISRQRASFTAESIRRRSTISLKRSGL